MSAIKKAVMAGVVGLALVMAGCNGDGDGVTPVSQSDLVAKWYFKRSVVKGYIRSVDADGTETFKFNMDEDTTFTGNTHYIEFKEDKTYTANFPEDETEEAVAKRAARALDLETGTWSVTGNKVKTISASSDTTELTVSIDGSNATFSYGIKESETDPETGDKFETDFDATFYTSK